MLDFLKWYTNMQISANFIAFMQGKIIVIQANFNRLLLFHDFNLFIFLNPFYLSIFEYAYILLKKVSV